MIQHFTNNKIDRQKWDACISRSCNCRIYALSWYLDICCKNWEGLVLGDYQAVMPLTSGKKYGISYLFQPHFAQQLGIFSPAVISRTDAGFFLKAIPVKFRFAEIAINNENSEKILFPSSGEGVQKEIGFAGFSMKSNSNYELHLSKNYQKISKEYSENTRRNIKKAVHRNVDVTPHCGSAEKIIRLFRKNKGKEFSHLDHSYFRTLGLLVEKGREKGFIKILYSFDKEKKLCAGAVFMIFQGRAIFLFSATNEEARENRVMFLLIDRFIFDHSENLSILDFEGSNDANLARFYKSFGAKEYVYLQLKKNNLPKYIQWLKK